MARAQIAVELCQNHNGDVELMKDMVAAAAESGATYVKMQSIFSEDLTRRDRFEEGAEGDAITRPYQPEYDRMTTLDLPPEAHEIFVEECLRYGVLPMTTLFNVGRLPLVRKSGNWAGMKVASYDCASFPMLRQLRDDFQFLMVSTGASYDHEIQTAANILVNRPFAFLHCVTIYPTPFEHFHLRRMDWLRQYAPLVGFSDHTLYERDGITGTKAAIWYGADIIERHFTILDRSETKDGPVSIRPDDVKELVQFANAPKSEQEKEVRSKIDDIEMLLGQPTRDMSDAELKNRDYYRGRFATKVDGEVIYNWEDRAAKI
jgi:N,N'-diacetyllegionaminate synthase